MMAEPNWPAIKARFERGEPPDKLAAAYKLPQKTIRGRARADSWDKSLQPKRKPSSGANQRKPARKAEPGTKGVAEHVSASTASVTVDVFDPVDYLDQHRDDAQGLRVTAIKLMAGLDGLDANAQARQLAAIATALKLSQDMQRKALGLDRGMGTLPEADSAADEETAEERRARFAAMTPEQRRQEIDARIRG